MEFAWFQWILLSVILILPSIIFYRKYVLKKRNNIIVIWISVGSFLVISSLISSLGYFFHKSTILVAPISIFLTTIYIKYKFSSVDIPIVGIAIFPTLSLLSLYVSTRPHQE